MNSLWSCLGGVFAGSAGTKVDAHDFIPPRVCLPVGDHLMAAAGSRCGVGHPESQESFLIVPHSGLFAISRGVGERGAGRIASQLAIDAIANGVVTQGQVYDECYWRSLLVHANKTIFEHNRSARERRHMYASFMLAWIRMAHVTIFSVGHNHAFQMRQGCLLRADHQHAAYAGRRFAAATDTSLKCKAVPGLGMRSLLEVQIQHRTWAPGDRLMLATSGITQALSYELIVQHMAAGISYPAHRVEAIMRCAEDARGRDDKTIVVVEQTTE